MNKTENNSNLGTWIFVLLSCAFVVAIGYKVKNTSDLTSEDNSISSIDDTTINNDSDDEFWNEIFEDDLEEVAENHTINNNTVEIKTEKKGDLLEDNVMELKNNENNIYVNKIIISKNIDNDKSSDTYRNPIDAFKTISTLDESVIKEVDYYPTLFIWSSVNTENVSLINENEEFEPINLSMTLKCKEKLVDKLDYTITANTPRWREWIEINLENIDQNMLNEFWNVEIVDNRNNVVLESRNFKLIDSNTVLEQTELNVETNIEKKEEQKVWNEQSDTDSFNFNIR